jgi:serine/threonine protein kinase
LEERGRYCQPPLTQSQNTQKIKEILTFQQWNESVCLQLFDHLCQGVAQLHSEGYSHHDLKLENVMFMGLNPWILAVPDL